MQVCHFNDRLVTFTSEQFLFSEIHLVFYFLVEALLLKSVNIYCTSNVCFHVVLKGLIRFSLLAMFSDLSLEV